MTQAPGGATNGDMVAAVLRLTDLAARIEGVDQAATRRIEDVARDCSAALEQVAGLRQQIGGLGGRADGIEQRLAEISGLLARMSGQIASLTSPAQDHQPKQQDDPDYQVHPAPPWWNPSNAMCADTVTRLRDWVAEVYQPVFGYLVGLLAPCWDRHPLCLTYLDTLHEAWCLLYIPERDPKMVFAQLDWLTRSLLQAVEVMANETRVCRDRGHHRDPSPAIGPVKTRLNGSA
jgi:hypothetical protein